MRNTLWAGICSKVGRAQKSLASALAVSVVMVGVMSPAAAASPGDTLAKAADSGRFTFGFREDARPFAYRDEDGKPAGYSVALCRRIAAQIKQTLNKEDLDVQFTPVTADERRDALSSGRIDLECGATSETLERRQSFDFSLQTFVTGAEMLVRTDSQIDDLSDVADKKVGVLKSTTTETGLKSALETQLIDAKVTPFERHEDGLAALENGDIDAYFADRILLLGLGQKAKDPSKLQLSGRFYSYEPYALMMRKGDERLRLAADTALANLYRSGQIWEIYEQYFGDAEPSELLVALFILEGLPLK